MFSASTKNNKNNKNNFVFRLFFASISFLFVFHIFNDLDLNSQYFVNVNADEIIAINDDDNNYADYGKERIDLSYTVDSSEYFEEDNFPQNNNYNNRNSQLISQQQSEEEKNQVYNQIKKEKEKASSSSSNSKNNNNDNNNKKYEFISIESKNNNENNDDDIKSNKDYVTFKVILNLQNIEKEGFLRVIAYINGQSFKEDIPLSELDLSTTTTTNKFDVNLKVLKDIELVSLSPPDEFLACAYHVKHIEIEYDSILYFDCNEADVQSSDGPNTIRLFKPSSMKYSDSKAFYEQNQQNGGGVRISKTINNDEDKENDNDDKVLIKIIAPLSDRKNTKELKIATMVRGQIQTETIKDVQADLDKSNDNTITRTFTFDRNTDIGPIQIGDLFLACVTSEDLNPPEGQECEKRLVKKFNSPNSLPAR